MTRTLALAALAAVTLAGAANAQEVKRTYPAPTAPIASSVVVPAGYETVYLSGALADPVTPAANGAAPVWGTTEQQAESVFTKLATVLKAEGLSEGDVIKMTIFLAGDPSQGGKMDFPGMMTAYRRHYGTPAQPNRPVRATVQVAALVAPGAFIEAEVTAVHKPK